MMFPPKANKDPYTLILHGDNRIDNYYWLRDDTRKNQSVLDYLKQENEYSDTILSSNKILQKQLFMEMIERIPQQDCSVPYVLRGYRYQYFYKYGQEYAIHKRQLSYKNINEDWEVLLNENERATQGKFYNMGTLEISPNNYIMAISEDFLSRNLYELRFKDLMNNFWFPEVIKHVCPYFKWSKNSKNIYYVRKHKENLRPYQVWSHTIGTSLEYDILIYEEKEENFYINLYEVASKKFIVISIIGISSKESLLLDSTNFQVKPQLFISRRHNHEYLIDHYKDYFYILSNKEDRNFALYRSNNNQEQFWQIVIPARRKVVLENFALFRNWLVIEERHMGLIKLRQINWLNNEDKYIEMNDQTYTAWLSYNPDPETSRIRYGYSSMISPTTLFEIDLDTNQHKILKQEQIKNFQTDNYHSERLWIKTRDKVEVPVSLVYRKDLFKSGTNALLVYGYGSYGHIISTNFSISRLSLLDRGFVFAIIHTRGGGELGKDWYEDGKLLNKMNTFYDFIDVSHSLLKQGYGNSSKIFAIGGSAGGLLIGAVINLAPKLFKGVIAQVPFVDVITTMLDKSIPLTTAEYEEWGNPQEEKYYRYMFKYSPYDQVSSQEYPHLLVTTGLYDSQVQYWEPAKWVAKLRELKTDNNLLLLCTDMNSGHCGKSGRFQQYEEISMEYAFILMLAKDTNLNKYYFTKN